MCGDQWTKRSRTILALLITLWSVRSFLELARESIHTITEQRDLSGHAVLLKVSKLD
jgi:steroid 5-alpha reductase family enzyme